MISHISRSQKWSIQALESRPPQFTQFSHHFNPLDSSATKRHKGTGVGLSMYKSLVELMGGTIGFRPNEIKGSTCWFTTNLIKTTQRPAAPSLIQQPTTKLTDTALAEEIFLVEDNIINQTVMVKLLKSSGFKDINVALNGKEGSSW